MIYKTITNSGNTVVVPTTSTDTVIYTTTKVIAQTTPVTIEKVKTVVETKEVVKPTTIAETKTEKSTISAVPQAPVTKEVLVTVIEKSIFSQSAVTVEVPVTTTSVIVLTKFYPKGLYLLPTVRGAC